MSLAPRAGDQSTGQQPQHGGYGNSQVADAGNPPICGAGGRIEINVSEMGPLGVLWRWFPALPENRGSAGALAEHDLLAGSEEEL